MEESFDPVLHRLRKAAPGFGCAVALIIVSFCLNQTFRFIYGSSPDLASWLKAHSHFVERVFTFVRSCLLLLVTYVASGCPAVGGFVDQTGLANRLTRSGWAIAWAAMAWGFLNLYTVQQGWNPANVVSSPYYNAGESAWSFYIVDIILVTPFFEEAIMRGYLYRAFRAGLGLIPSTILVLCVNTYFHWGLVKQNWIALIFLTGLASFLCLIREYTRNTWNGVLFHAAYMHASASMQTESTAPKDELNSSSGDETQERVLGND